MDLMQLLQSQLDDNVIGQLSEQIGAEPQQTAVAANDIFATLVGGLANNASSEGGLNSLVSALDRNHDGSVLDDVMGMVGGLMQNSGQGSGATNGLGILNHVLGGDQQEAAAQQISQHSGLSMSKVMQLMPVLAPIVMGAIGKMRSQEGLQMSDLPGLLMGSVQNTSQQGGMGDLLGNILGNVLGGGQQQQQGGGFGNILGKILGGGR